MASTAATSTPLATGSRSGRSTHSSTGRATAPSASSVSSSSSISPTRLSRLQEKDALRSLNDRLANYIQRVQDLESERSTLLIRLEETDESKTREVSTMRRLYEEELADVRTTLDSVANEKARLQIELGNLAEELKKLQNKHQKNEGELATALSHWRKAEAALTSREADISKLLSAKRRLEEQVSGQQEQLRNVEGELSETKELLNSEMIQRIDLENQVQTAKNHLAFHKTLSEQETQEIRSRSKSQLLEVETVRRRKFETKLADAIQQLRQDHEAQVLQYREEMDRTFSSKKLSLEGRVQELERTLNAEREAWQQEMLSLRSQMFTQLEDYEKLLDTKLALDMEINSYRKMLEVEEQRLQLSPSPSQRATVSRKRKHEGPTVSSPASKMSSCSTEGSPASSSDLDHCKEDSCASM